MKRKMYETKKDLAREREIVDVLCAEWGCAGIKNPCPPYKIDWSLLRDDRIVAMAEIKTTFKKFPSFRLAHHKYLSLLENAKVIKTLLVVKHPDGIFYNDIEMLKPNFLCWLQDARQRDVTDSEPGVDFSWNQFFRVGD